MGLFGNLFNWQGETEHTLEQLLDGTDAAAGVVRETSPGHYEVVATENYDYQVPLLPENEISVLDLMDQHGRGK